MTDTGTVAGGEAEGGVAVLPFYVVCDESSSMIGESIEAVNAGIGELFRTIHGDPVVDAKARVGIISFNSQAEVALPLSQLSSIVQIPRCARSDEPARYASVFNLLKKEIDVDADERIGWSPIVNCHFDGSDISVEIVKGLAGQPDYFRLSTVVLPDSPWNLEIASEINAWNNQWTNVKLVRHETNLVALRDVVAEELDLTPEAVVDLVKKSKVVAEVVSVFL
jgi:hypothetical protein